jgi:hypothetical protein
MAQNDKALLQRLVEHKVDAAVTLLKSIKEKLNKGIA